MNCPHCGSPKLGNKGYNKKRTKKRYQCLSCPKSFSVDYQQPTLRGLAADWVILDDDVEYDLDDITVESTIDIEVPVESKDDTFALDEDYVRFIEQEYDTFVITSIQNDTTTWKEMLASLKYYCSSREARLMIIPVRYKNPSAMINVDGCSWDEELAPYMIENEVRLGNHVKVVGNLNVQATAVNPLSGLDPITQGRTTIFGHAQLAMSTIPVNKHLKPIIMTTTGSLSTKGNYSDSKAGFKADFHHTNSAIVVELDRKNDSFHIRQLVADETGSFYDVYGHYTPEGIKPLTSVPGLVCGDEHVLDISPSVKEATWGKQGSIVSTLRPEIMVRQDVLDCFTISHHHRLNPILKYVKLRNGRADIMKEMALTCSHINETTPHYSKSLVIECNHNSHLTKWLNEADPKLEPWNAKAYHELMYMVMDAVDQKSPITDPFELWYNKYYREANSNVHFAEGDVPVYIKGILVTMHGDVGPNGARGSRKNISKIAEKTIIGHSHSPGIEKGCWQVGTSSKLILEYNNGPSGWMNTHCIIYPNGKRQLINIIDGEWRRDKY